MVMVANQHAAIYGASVTVFSCISPEVQILGTHAFIASQRFEPGFAQTLVFKHGQAP
jgi:hypothetical protein